MTVRRTSGDGQDLDPNDVIVGDRAAVDQELSDAARMHVGEDLFDATLWTDWYALKMTRARPEVYVEALRASLNRVPVVRSVTPRSFVLTADRNLSVVFDVRLIDDTTATLAGVIETSAQSALSNARLFWVTQ